MSETGYERRRKLTITSWSEYRDEFLRLTDNHAKILDVGVGGGLDSEFFADHGRKVVSVDIRANNLRRASLETSNVVRTQMDFSKFGFAENSFDAIWLANVLIFAKDDEERESIIRRCAKLIKPGGIMFLCDNFFSSSKELEEIMAEEGWHSSYRIRKMFDRDFEVLREDVGIDIPEKRSFASNEGFHVLFVKVRKNL